MRAIWEKREISLKKNYSETNLEKNNCTCQCWKSVYGHPKPPWHFGFLHWVCSFRLFQYHFYYFDKYFIYSICNYKRQSGRCTINLLIPEANINEKYYLYWSIIGSRQFSQVEVDLLTSIPVQTQWSFPWFLDLNMECRNSEKILSNPSFRVKSVIEQNLG